MYFRVVESILTKSPSLVDLPTGPEQHASLHIAVQKRNKAGVAAALINKVWYVGKSFRASPGQ